MTQRIVTPVNPAAFATAQQAYVAKYGAGPAPAPGTKAHRKQRAQWLKFYEKAGGQVDKGKTFQNKIPGVLVEPCPLKNEIESVEFLDGGTTPMAADGTQHVNLPRDQMFVDGVHVANLDRLTRTLRVRVKFRRAKAEQFKLRLLAHNGNATYTAPEQQARPTYQCPRVVADPDHVNGNFDQYQGAVVTGKTKSTGIAVLDAAFEIPVSGGDKYQLVAWDVNGNVVHSAYKLTTLRTLYYATFLADDPNNVGINQAAFRTQFEQTYAGHHINMVWAGSEQLNGIVYHDILFVSNVGDAVRTLAQTKNSSLGRPYQDLAPYVVKLAFVDHCTDTRKKNIDPVRVNGASPGDLIDVPIYVNTPVQRAAVANFDWRKCLWIGLGASADVAVRPATGHEWFHGATLTEHRPAGDVVTALADTDFTGVPRSPGQPEAICQLRFTVPASVPPNTDVSVNMEVVIMYHAVLGQSLEHEHAGITIQPARHHFVPVPQNKQLSSAVHECGHAIGMVATTNKQGLTHDHHYLSNGDHCWTSIAGPAANPGDYHKAPLKDTGTCLMYGLIPDLAPNMNFCPACAEVLRKLDLTSGFTG